jgi:hypothetical protein
VWQRSMFTIRRAMAGFVLIDSAPGSASPRACFYLRRSSTVISMSRPGRAYVTASRFMMLYSDEAIIYAWVCVYTDGLSLQHFTASGVRLWSSKTADGSQSARRHSPWHTGIEFQDDVE